MKNRILYFLKEERGTYVSGEEISNRLGISRAGVWKHINSLREEGYEIDSKSRLGYMLIGEPDLLLPSQVSYGLSTEVIGKVIHHSMEMVSTNREARALADEGKPEGTVVVTERQTDGKGRLGRTWLSPPGGIWLSVILRPGFQPLHAPKLTLVAAVAVAKTLREEAHLDTKIKWPNDVYIGSRKICGILTEMSAELDRINYVVLGIGVNANVDVAPFPPEIRDRATSIMMELGKPISRVALLRALLTQFERTYFLFLREGFEPIRQEIKADSYTLGRWVKVRHGKKDIEGEAVDIDKDGALLVRTIEGRMVTIVSGDVGEEQKTSTIYNA